VDRVSIIRYLSPRNLRHVALRGKRQQPLKLAGTRRYSIALSRILCLSSKLPVDIVSFAVARHTTHRTVQR